VDETQAESRRTELRTSQRSRMAQWSALAALGISALALAVGAYQTRLMQTQARASVWPYVKIGFAYSDRGDNKGFDIHVDNDGVGPALVRSVQVSLDGTPLPSWNDAFARIMTHGTAFAHLQGLSGAVIPPNTNRETTIRAIRIDDAGQSAKFYEARDRFKIDICYCSIYDDCWIAHWLTSKVDSVAACNESKNEFDY
jgi:hypothetical protein